MGLHFTDEETWGFERLSYSLRYPGLVGMKMRWKTEAPQASCTCQQADLECSGVADLGVLPWAGQEWLRVGLVHQDPQSPGILLPWHPLERGNRLKGRTPSAQVTGMSWQNLLTGGEGGPQLPLSPHTDKGTEPQNGQAEPHREPVIGPARWGTEATSLGTRLWTLLSLLAWLQGMGLD